MGLKNKYAAMVGIMGMFAAMGGEMPHGYRKDIEPKETDEERKKRLAKAEIERHKANGLKEFIYGQNSVWAINQKTADNKAKKKGYIKVW